MDTIFCECCGHLYTPTATACLYCGNSRANGFDENDELAANGNLIFLDFNEQLYPADAVNIFA